MQYKNISNLILFKILDSIIAERPTSSIIATRFSLFIFSISYFYNLLFISVHMCACFNSFLYAYHRALHLRRRPCMQKSRLRVLHSLNTRLSSPDTATTFPIPYFRLPYRTLHHPLSTAPPKLRYYFGVASAGSMHTRRRRSRVIYDYAREHDKPRHGGQKVDTTREGYASRRPILSWTDISMLSRPSHRRAST